MKYILLCFVIISVIEICLCQEKEVESTFGATDQESFRVLKRIVRQEPPRIPGMPPPPQMPDMKSFLRKRREAKGVSGSLPTRKG
ncbi:unnamed protein product [Colias eurytheme]|nr:unnamed protein product [Colias eurytheme]